MTMNKPYNEWAQEIHANSVEHGWWDEPRTPSELAGLFCSEWSEALEEFRAGRPMVWADVCTGEITDGNVAMTKRITGYGVVRQHPNCKPEGIAVELVDGCIRILDYLATVLPSDDPGHWYISPQIGKEYSHLTPAALPFELTRLTVHAYDLDPDKLELGTLRGIIAIVAGWLKAHGLDIEEIMELKHAYNRTRPYRHGGKRL
jgi:hypothetical protein